MQATAAACWCVGFSAGHAHWLQQVRVEIPKYHLLAPVLARYSPCGESQLVSSSSADALWLVNESPYPWLMHFSIWYFVMISRSRWTACKSHKNRFSVLYSFIIFLYIIPIGFQSQVFSASSFQCNICDLGCLM